MLQRQLSLQQSPKSGNPGSSSSSSSSDSSTDENEAAVQQVEMVLEAYFMHMDNTYNKLQTLTECKFLGHSSWVCLDNGKLLCWTSSC